MKKETLERLRSNLVFDLLDNPRYQDPDPVPVGHCKAIAVVEWGYIANLQQEVHDLRVRANLPK